MKIPGLSPNLALQVLYFQHKWWLQDFQSVSGDGGGFFRGNAMEMPVDGMHGDQLAEKGFSSRGIRGCNPSRGFSATGAHKSAGQRATDAWRAVDTWLSGKCTRVEPTVVVVY